MRRLAVVAVAALAILATTSSAFALQDEVSINIVDAPRPQPKWGYAPGKRTIAPGTWVTWSNNGQDAHTVTAEDGSFDSGNLDPSEGFSWYFDEPGVYTYVCSLHPWMTGKIIVAEPSAVSGQPSATPSSDATTLQDASVSTGLNLALKADS